ncbi:hypothetical protein GALMADRAFT_231519 [Galerina marginata CBS 339.88]|uniref:MYND-type domain-containing protein n=1 Tax=Galerina marginata (strain CBS 339.88) TaxID=685588 RepID=A0A067SB57_GALM3|nr:hypothetical protein GALMADRAFT_231519 [Galerina marginata CBS 339.88]
MIPPDQEISDVDRLSLSLVPHSKASACFTCNNTPGANQEYQRCAKCRLITYCSRECQKKDWPIHKEACFAANDQSNFVIKCFQRMHTDKTFMHYLDLDLADKFCDSFTQNPKKMWIIVTSLFILPSGKEDLKAATSQEIPENPMAGHLVLSGFINVSAYPDYPVEDKVRRMWQQVRDDLDGMNAKDAVAVIVEFNYMRFRFYISARAISKSQLVEAKKGNRSSERRRTSLWVEEMRNRKGDVMPCVMGDDDIKFMRTGK